MTLALMADMVVAETASHPQYQPDLTCVSTPIYRMVLPCEQAPDFPPHQRRHMSLHYLAKVAGAHAGSCSLTQQRQDGCEAVDEIDPVGGGIQTNHLKIGFIDSRNQEIGCPFIFKGLIIGTCSYFGAIPPPKTNTTRRSSRGWIQRCDY
jgi:hypothetical protein